MAAIDAAAALLRTRPAGVPASAAVTLTAISGAEATWILNRASTVDLAAHSRYTCPMHSAKPAPFSWGPWQENVQAHYASIPGSDACQKVAWLTESWDNAATAAWGVYQSQGFGAWCTWWKDCAARTGPGEGPYLGYMPQAQAAVDAAMKLPVATTTTTTAPKGAPAFVVVPPTVTVGAGQGPSVGIVPVALGIGALLLVAAVVS